MVLRAEQAGGWEVVRPPASHEGVELVGYHDRGGRGLQMRVLPEPGVTIVLMLDGELRIDRTRPVAAGIASGVGVNSVPVDGLDVACVDIHLSPLAAHSILGGSIAELAGTVVGLEDLWGAKAHRLGAALAGTDRWDERFDRLRAALAEELAAHRPVDPEVAFAWRRLVAGGGRLRITDLAAETGWSRKRLWSRFTDQVGVTPKRAAMIVRLSPAIRAIMAGTAAAEVAAGHGYADQSHLTRDLRDLAGYTPTSLYRAWTDGALGRPTSDWAGPRRPTRSSRRRQGWRAWTRSSPGCHTAGTPGSAKAGRPCPAVSANGCR